MVEFIHLTSNIGLLLLDNKGKIEAESEMITLLHMIALVVHNKGKIEVELKMIVLLLLIYWTWNVEHGNGDEVLKLYERMQLEGVRNVIIFI